MKVYAVVGAFVCFFSLPIQAHSASLHRFLDNLDRSCNGTDAFEAFRSSLIKRYVHPTDLDQSIEAPEELKPLMGQPTVNHQPNPGGWFHVSIPLRGQFRGLDVVAVEFVFGDGNGIHASAIAFANSFEEVSNTLGKEVKAANRKAQEEHEKLVASGLAGADPEHLSVQLIDGRSKLTCDQST